MCASELITTHLNAPVGRVLAADDVRLSLLKGRLSCHSEKANAVLGGLFIEVEPRLIARCVLEEGLTIQQANDLYLDTLAHGFARCPVWESSVEFLL